MYNMIAKSKQTRKPKSELEKEPQKQEPNKYIRIKTPEAPKERKQPEEKKPPKHIIIKAPTDHTDKRKLVDSIWVFI